MLIRSIRIAKILNETNKHRLELVAYEDLEQGSESRSGTSKDKRIYPVIVAKVPDIQDVLLNRCKTAEQRFPVEVCARGEIPPIL